MIKTSRQLKDLTRNLSKGDSGKAQFLLRNYAMERFLERMSVSQRKTLMRTAFLGMLLYLLPDFYAIVVYPI